MAHVLHWSLAELDAMDVEEAAYWADQAEQLLITLHTPRDS